MVAACCTDRGRVRCRYPSRQHTGALATPLAGPGTPRIAGPQVPAHPSCILDYGTCVCNVSQWVPPGPAALQAHFEHVQQFQAPKARGLPKTRSPPTPLIIVTPFRYLPCVQGTRGVNSCSGSIWNAVVTLKLHWNGSQSTFRMGKTSQTSAIPQAKGYVSENDAFVMKE